MLLKLSKHKDQARNRNLGSSYRTCQAKCGPKVSQCRAITTGHCNIKSYLYKCKIIDKLQCQCKNGEQTVQHIIFECTIFDQESDKLKAVVMRTENWPVSCNKLSTIYYKNFKEYIDSIIWDD